MFRLRYWWRLDFSLLLVFFSILGDSQGMSRMTVSRMIDNIIKFPSDNAEKIHIMQKYYQLSKFPNVLWCIDGTHIAVRSTSRDKHLFVNRKCFQSINVQGVCDADLTHKYCRKVAKLISLRVDTSLMCIHRRYFMYFDTV